MGADYKIIENRLLINEVTVSFEYNIGVVEHLGGIYIVMLDCSFVHSQ